jgi:hypothetical protein
MEFLLVLLLRLYLSILVLIINISSLLILFFFIKLLGPAIFIVISVLFFSCLFLNIFFGKFRWLNKWCKNNQLLKTIWDKYEGWIVFTFIFLTYLSALLIAFSLLIGVDFNKVIRR